MKNNNTYRCHFPILEHDPGVVYLDSAATSLKPKQVLHAIQSYYQEYTANVSRGAYTWAQKSTRLVNDTRKKVASFINANSLDEVVFTSGTTHSINTIAYSWGLSNLKHGDEIIVGGDDHKSTVEPWYNLKRLLHQWNIEIKIKELQYTSTGRYNLEQLKQTITPRTRLASLTHVHNVYGVDMEIETIRTLIPDSVLIALDAAQSIGHTPVDVQALSVDFLSFSGHKLFAETGSGVLWVKNSHHKLIQPFMTGGETELDKAVYHRLESGTPHISGIISLGAAIDFVEDIGVTAIHAHLVELTQYAIARLKEVPHIELLPGYAHCSCRDGYGIVAFKVPGTSSGDIGFIMDQNNIFLRTGTHCRAHVDDSADSIRISMHLYNTKEDIDKCIATLRTIVQNM